MCGNSLWFLKKYRLDHTIVLSCNLFVSPAVLFFVLFCFEVLTHREIVISEKPHISFHINGYRVQCVGNWFLFFLNLNIALINLFNFLLLMVAPLLQLVKIFWYLGSVIQNMRSFFLALSHFQCPPGPWMWNGFEITEMANSEWRESSPPFALSLSLCLDWSCSSHAEAVCRP